jgi:hypothetical protein
MIKILESSEIFFAKKCKECISWQKKTPELIKMHRKTTIKILET